MQSKTLIACLILISLAIVSVEGDRMRRPRVPAIERRIPLRRSVPERRDGAHGHGRGIHPSMDREMERRANLRSALKNPALSDRRTIHRLRAMAERTKP